MNPSNPSINWEMGTRHEPAKAANHEGKGLRTAHTSRKPSEMRHLGHVLPKAPQTIGLNKGLKLLMPTANGIWPA